MFVMASKCEWLHPSSFSCVYRYILLIAHVNQFFNLPCSRMCLFLLLFSLVGLTGNLPLLLLCFSVFSKGLKQTEDNGPTTKYAGHGKPLTL